MYETFDDLPNAVRQLVVQVGEIDLRSWVQRACPALSGKSIIEVMNEENGLERVMTFLRRVAGRFS
jgi:hypothetical protein